MAISFRILPVPGIVYIRYEGRMGVAESSEAMARYVADPGYRKGMRQLVDLSAVTDWERDFPALMQLMARQADVYNDPNRPTLIVSLAPTDTARAAANIACRAWERSQRVVVVVVDTEAEALSVLGIDTPSITALLASA